MLSLHHIARENGTHTRCWHSYHLNSADQLSPETFVTEFPLSASVSRTSDKPFTVPCGQAQSANPSTADASVPKMGMKESGCELRPSGPPRDLLGFCGLVDGYLDGPHFREEVKYEEAK
jgi:hypothetical protein